MSQINAYVVLHSHPEGLVLPRQQRELLIGAGRGAVLDIIECSTYSLQADFFKNIKRRPLTLILWGMEDRYGIAEQQSVEILAARSFGDALTFIEESADVTVQ